MTDPTSDAASNLLFEANAAIAANSVHGRDWEPSLECLRRAAAQAGWETAAMAVVLRANVILRALSAATGRPAADLLIDLDFATHAAVLLDEDDDAR